MTASYHGGIDPGNKITGWAVVARNGTKRSYVASGVIKPPRKLTAVQRHGYICDELVAAFEPHSRVGRVAIEDQFSYRNVKTALVLAQARGACHVAICQLGLDALPVNPTTLKQAIGGHAKADKEQVAQMACAMLGCAIPKHDDESDALALALFSAMTWRG